MLRFDKLWYELGTNYCPTCYVSSRFDPALMRLCYAWNHALISFYKLYYALLRFDATMTLKSGSDTIIKLCCALLRSVKLCFALENVEIADLMPLLTQSYK